MHKRTKRKKKKALKADMDINEEECMVQEGVDDRNLVGRFVKKGFGELGLFIGKVVSCRKGLYRVNYEDGDREDLELHELREILASVDEMEGELKDKKDKLEGRRPAKRAKRTGSRKSAINDRGLNTGGRLSECIGVEENTGPGTGKITNAGKTLATKIPEADKILKNTEAAESTEPDKATEECKIAEAENNHVPQDNIKEAGKTMEPGNIMEAGKLTETGKTPEEGKIGEAGETSEAGKIGEAEPNIVVEGSESRSRRRGRPKKISENLREPEVKIPWQAEFKSIGIDVFQQGGRGRPRKDAIVVASQNNAFEKKLNSSKRKEISSEKLGLPSEPKKCGRKRKSQTGSRACTQEDDVSEESEQYSWQKELSCASAKRRKRVRRKSASARWSDSDIEEDDPSSKESFVVNNEDIEEDYPFPEESFIATNEEASSDNETFDNNDSGPIALSTKPNNYLLPLMQPLPQSSGNLPIPENSVADLFSVYMFLRSFSDLLFLSPFSLDDFVGALNFKTTNSLLDSVHVSLLRALRRHLEMLTEEGNDMATKCLRQLDWDFLDAVTWPVYLAEYLLTQCTNGRFGQNIANLKILDGDYYRIMPSIKLAILQFLCDDVMEAEEFRAKIDMRMGPEHDIDADGKMDLSSTATELFGRNSCHSKSKRISCNKEDVQKSSHEDTNSISDNSIIQNKHIYLNNGQESTTLEANDVQDFNSDECRLCGMDGNLLCCDGCPSAYHSRCVGVSKAHLLEGAWYCPECVVKKTDAPELKVLQTLNGAEIFGIDPYERVFFGTCGYLIVSDSASSPTSLYRYYNRSDVSKVLEAFDLSGPFYNNIRTAIIQYWDISDQMNDSAYLQNSDMISGNSHTDLSYLSLPEYPINYKEARAPGLTSVSTEVRAEKNDSARNHDYLPGLYTTDCKVTVNDELLVTGLNNAKETDFTSVQGAPGVVPNSAIDRNVQECESILEQQKFDLENEREAGWLVPVKCGSMHILELTELNAHDRTGAQVDVNKSKSFVKYEQTDSFRKVALKLDLKASFKPNTYINQYAIGDIAASAAANLASLNGASKKTLVATMQEHVKAFSKVSGQFYWPNFGKKTMEPPKDRCGWCLSCKSPPSCRRACLLNMAACNVMAGAAKVPGGLRPTKKGGGHLAAVAAYILYIEDCLRGLIVGPWENPDYRKYWRKRVEQSATVREISTSLLELEQNIRHIALAPGWTKHVEDPSSLVSTCHTGASAALPTPKRGGSIRRHQKNIASSIIASTPNNSGNFGVCWWRGGKLSQQVFQQGVLPCATAKRTGRQGGLKRIPGVSYAEGSDMPRRSRHYVWRAAVEKATSVSQLAIQVRYLDANVKWEELVSPEDHSQDVKAVGKEVNSFRIATLCEKKYELGDVKYLLDFGNHKDIPISVLKHGRKIEEAQEGTNRYWLGEFYVPLHLVKAFEERVLKDCTNNGCKQVWVDKNRKSQGTRKDIFSFRLSTVEMHEKSSCGYCRVDVSFRELVRCSSCDGSVHRECTTTDMLDKSECNFTCYKCYNVKLVEREDTDNILITQSNSKFVPFPADKQDQYSCLSLRDRVEDPEGNHAQPFGANTMLRDKVEDPEGNFAQPFGANTTLRDKVEDPEGNCVQPSGANTKLQKYTGVVMNPAHRRGSYDPNGLTWKKNSTRESGKDFIKKKILLACENNMSVSKGPQCFACREAYNPKLMYVGCDSCDAWFHGDAFGLNHENAVQLAGFKCHRCRKKSAPICPYKRDHSNKKDHSARREKLPVKRPQMKASKDISQDSRKSNGKPSKVMHSESGKILNKLCSMLNAEEKHVATKIEPDSKYMLPGSLSKHNQQNHAAIKDEPDLKHAREDLLLGINQSGGELMIFQSPEFSHDTVKSEPDLKHAHEASPLDINQSDPAIQRFQHLELSSLGTEALSTQGNLGFSVTDWPCHNQQIEFRESAHNTLEPYTENEPLFTFTELLACENDQMEDLVGLSREIVGNWSDGFSTGKDINMDSQQMGIETNGYQFSGATISSNNLDSQLENESKEENIMEFQLHCAANSVVSDETHFNNPDNTVRSEEIGNLCKVCGFTVFPSGYQCKVCGLAIHEHCSDLGCSGMWTTSGWTCDGCQGGLVEGQGLYL
ncbi:hypothetical protein KI387_016458 [Taxus chinensis]|uniref:Uncharacterized protein n=1 Tax=Taxus chinensis TaxID=29808 RepID=A0AA38GEM0_TAXCH|nr:hypothetical protein KI387_016458 [Taxus chinensis]